LAEIQRSGNRSEVTVNYCSLVRCPKEAARGAQCSIFLFSVIRGHSNLLLL